MREVHDGLFVGGINAPIQNNIDFDRIVSLHMESENTTHAHPIYDGKHNYDEFSEAVDSVIDGLQN